MRLLAFNYMWSAGSLLAAISGDAASAQDVSASPEVGTQFDRNRTVAVAQRVQPGFEETGTRLGSLILYPRLRGLAAFEDNVRASPADRQGDVAFSIEPSVRGVTDWSRHQVGISASAAVTRFAKLDTENTETFAVRADGRYDLGDELRLFGSAGIRRDVERRSAPGALRNSLRPAVYNTATAATQLTWQGNRLRLSADGSVARIDYRDVTTVEGLVFDSRELNRSRYQVGIRADYALTADLALLITGTWGKIDYNLPPTSLTPDRSARRAELLGGVSFEFTDLLRGEVAVGYIDQDFRNALIPDFSGLGGRAQIEYFPSRLTTVHVEASRTLQEAGNPLAPTYQRTRAGVRVDHELFRHVVLSGSADFENDRFRLPARKERRWHFSGSAQYLLNRNVTLFGRYDYLRVTTSPAQIGRKLTDNVISVGLLFKP